MLPLRILAARPVQVVPYRAPLESVIVGEDALFAN